MNISSDPLRGDIKPGDKGADIAAAPLTITSKRLEAVDFIKPFQHLGLTVLIKRPIYKTDWPFNFNILKPLTPAVWCSAVISMIVVSGRTKKKKRKGLKPVFVDFDRDSLHFL